MDYSSLREQPASRLKEAEQCAGALLRHKELLPLELLIKLESFHADVTALLEDREDEDNS
jgi:hypothetical protein